MELSEQEAHCIARLLQGAWYGEDLLDGCTYCKFTCDDNLSMREQIKKRLTEETGVDLNAFQYGTIPHSKFPYKKFLKSSNEEMRKYYHERFSYLLGDT